jgi:hypothetical protein
MQGPHGSGYEFTDVENRVIARAAFWARALGIALLVTAGLGLLNLNVIGAIINGAVGLFMLAGGASLDAVVKTQGNDVAHMMTALGKLGNAFQIRVVVLTVGLMLVLGLSAFLTFLVMGHHSIH